MKWALGHMSHTSSISISLLQCIEDLVRTFCLFLLIGLSVLLLSLDKGVWCAA